MFFRRSMSQINFNSETSIFHWAKNENRSRCVQSFSRSRCPSGQGLYSEAIEKYKEGLKICEEVGHLPTEAYIYAQMTHAAAMTHNFEEAKKYIDISQKLFSQSGGLRGIAYGHATRGEYFSLMSEWTQALESYTTSLKISESLNDYINIAFQHGNIGKCLFSLGNSEEGMNHFKISQQLFIEFGTPGQIQEANWQVNNAQGLLDDELVEMFRDLNPIRAKLLQSQEKIAERLQPSELEPLREMASKTSLKSNMPQIRMSEYEILDFTKYNLALNPFEMEKIKDLSFEAHRLSSSNIEKAIEITYEMVEIEPRLILTWSLITVMMSRALIKYQKPRVSGLLRKLTSLADIGVKFNPYTVSCWSDYAVLHYLEGDYASAAKGYDKVIELYREVYNEKINTHHLMSYVDVHLALENNKKVLDYYANILTDPSEKEGHGIVYILDKSRLAYESLEDKVNHNKIAIELRDILENRVRSNPNDRFYCTEYGFILGKLGDNKKGIEFGEKALNLPPQYDGWSYDSSIPYVWNNLGGIYKGAKDYDNALRCFQKAMEYSKTYPIINSLPFEETGDIYGELGDIKKAKQYYLKAFEMDPQRKSVQRRMRIF